MKTKASAYASVVLELALVEDNIEDIDQDLRIIADTISKNLKLKDSLIDSDVELVKKYTIISEIFKDKVSDVAFNFLLLLVGQGEIGRLNHILDELISKIQHEQKKVIAEVITAIELDKMMQSKLEKKLSKISGKEVKLRNIIDESIIGGVIVRLDGKLYDGSLINQLNNLQSKMVTGKAEGDI